MEVIRVGEIFNGKALRCGFFIEKLHICKVFHGKIHVGEVFHGKNSC